MLGRIFSWLKKHFSSKTSLMKVFIGHSSLEKSLANALAEWIKVEVPNTHAFCSDLSEDLAPSLDWLQTIISEARASNLCLVLLSPDSLALNWLYFEAGLTLGAQAHTNSVAPVLYGGLTNDKIPAPLKHAQALIINDRDSFNAFVNRVLKAGGGRDWFDHFTTGLRPEVGRLIEYGLYGGAFGECELERQESETWEAAICEEDVHEFPRVSDAGEIVAIRASVTPRPQRSEERWKFGIRVQSGAQVPRTGLGRIHEFHSGKHDNRTTWTIYDDPGHTVPFNVPAPLAIGQEHRLELWFSSDHRHVVCIGIDSQGARVCLRNALGNVRWRLARDDWDRIVVKAWGDKEPIRVDVNWLEIHRRKI